ncbi:MAG: hypothetical protein WKH64_05695 [Chloroflexia bacterium]
MNILENLLGGDDQKRNELQDFTNRYEQGAPHDNLSDSEVQDRYAQVAPQLSDQDYQMSAEQAFERMPPKSGCGLDRCCSRRLASRVTRTQRGTRTTIATRILGISRKRPRASARKSPGY